MRKWLLIARLDKEMTQKNLCEKIGISQPSYCLIEKGKNKPRPSTAKKIAAVLGVDWTRFYEEEGNGTPVQR
mgnify:FL=1|jgi:transcriptional regulator with XRE-family HTH domain|uniref:Helix-turn-helix domain protein n=1 Tax=Siphoviridae sp. ctS1E53 TaxID=2826340 RepID=A0A8S5MED2_9CAUD|nr:MAG TPA: helix-turn-helix domain protein [Siphoviridae sp. ctS1E53]